MSDRVRASASTLPGTHRFFQFAGRFAFIFLPRTQDPGKPWVWYAPTLEGNHPGYSNTWMLRRILEAGRAIAGVDVGESYGNPEGRRTFTRFYESLVAEHSLSPQVALLAQSRGGLMLYNWAVEHAECVACVAGIYPVCDIASYPGLETASPAYGMTPRELEAHLQQHNPVDRLRPLAARKVPIMHVHGDADDKVPLEPNSAELTRRYAALGGDARLHIVAGGRHSSSSDFYESQALVDFVLSQRDRQG